MQEHLAKPHSRRNGRRPILKHPLPQPVTPNAKVFQECPNCGIQVRKGRLEIHLTLHRAAPEQPMPTAAEVRRKCPECDREMREDLLERHINIFHRYQQPVLPEGPLKRPKPLQAKVFRECPSCGIQVREDRLAKHVAQTHPQVLPTEEIPEPILEASAPARDNRPEQQIIVPSANLVRKEPAGTNAPGMPPRVLLQCPKCGSKVREDRMQRHLSKVHPAPTRPDAPDATAAKALPTVRPFAACPDCGAKVREDCMGLHLVNCHSEPRSFQPGARRLPFVLLPPGTWDIRHVVAHYRKVAKDLGGTNRRQIDWTRLEQIKALDPVRCYIGKDSWLGYVVFEFAHSASVVLECPIEGNATYVLSGDWKAMVGHTKAELRHRFANRYTRIVHKGCWSTRIRAALHKR